MRQGTLNRLRGIQGGVDYNELGRFREGSQNYRQGFLEAFTEGLAEGHIDPNSFSLRRLFEHLVEHGREIMDSWNPMNQGSSRVMLTESGGAISTADFSNITGQIIFAEILKAWDNPAMLHPQLVNDVQTPFSGEKIPGIGNVGDLTQIVREGRDYPVGGVSEEWIDTPATTKRGLILEVTKEAAWFDRTGLVLERARNFTQALLINKEKRVLDAVLGIIDLYRRNGGAAQPTYGATHANGDFNNLKTTNALVDWTNVEAAELLFDDIVDPNTGEPILIDRTKLQIVCATAKAWSADRIINATEVSARQDQGGGSAAFVYETRGENPIKRKPPILSNAYVKARSGSSTSWWYGDFKGAFEYRQNWPITPVTQPATNHDEFHRDIIQSTKISEMGTVACREPRLVMKNTA